MSRQQKNMKYYTVLHLYNSSFAKDFVPRSREQKIPWNKHWSAVLVPTET